MPSTPSDIELIEKLRQGDKAVLLALYDKYGRALYGVILKMCKKEDLAKDLLQETFLKIWEKIDQYDPDRGKFFTWSYRIAKNITLNSLRKTSPIIQTDDLSVYANRDPEDSAPKDFSQLNGTLKLLQPHHQRALTLVYFNGLTHREAHQEMNVPLGTFKSYIKQALKQMREHYGKMALSIVVCIIL